MIEAARIREEWPLRQVFLAPIERLRLDRCNPRFIGSTNLRSDESIIAHLYRADALGELLQSISANGYLDIEPLIVLQEKDTLLVLEGNRRLSAIRLFREPHLVERINALGRMRITLSDLSEKYRNTLDQVSVYRVKDLSEARSFIGFKHINGPAKWESYAKAKFAADWNRNTELSLSQIAECIGDKHDTIKRMVNAIYVLEQAESEGIFEIEDRSTPRFSFSHLYIALTCPQYRDFLGLPSKWVSYDPSPNPVPGEKLGRLAEVMRWIYGSMKDEVKSVIQTQNPDIGKLAEVLASTEGVNVLKVTKSLTQAHASIQPADDRFSGALILARSHLQEALHSLRGFDGADQSLIEISKDILESSRTIHESMTTKLSEPNRGYE